MVNNPPDDDAVAEETDPESFTTVHATFADRERLRTLRRVILERGAAALPPALAERLRASMLSSDARHKSIGLGVVLSLALDVLEDVIGTREESSNAGT